MRTLLLAPLLCLGVGCASAPVLDPADLPFFKLEPGKEDTSAEAVFLNFTFDGELVTDSTWNVRQQIEDQLLYTIGQLNGDRSVARLDRVVLSDIETAAEGGRTRVTYTAVLPVAWGRRTAIPTEHTLRLPRDMTSAALERFATSYGHTCVDVGAHDVDSGSMWYYYRPARSGCRLADTDVVSPIADVTLSEVNTTGRFPEYDRVWEDNALRVVAVFGKYEDGATTSADAGVAAYNRFLVEIRRELAAHTVVTTPATVPSNPGVSVPEVTFTATVADGRQIVVVAILVDNVRTAGRTFDTRFGQLSSNADLIVYNGHAGLGANVRALASKGRWVRGQYAIVFMNGCDTYAYVDNALWAAHAAINPDDPDGTKYMDIVTNAMPSYFSSMPRATLALVRALVARDAPRTYEQLFAEVDSQQVILVSGEQDNTYTPGSTPGPTPTGWAGLRESGTAAAGQERRFAIPALAAGRYRFAMTGTGDADLYVRIGSAPTTRAYDCRPYRSDAAETCDVELTSSAPIHVMVRGYSASTFALTGARR